MSDLTRLVDGITLSVGRQRTPDHEVLGIEGHYHLELFDARGRLIDEREGRNLVTDVGDLYVAQKVIAAIAPANASAPTAMTGMKLGTGTTAAAKSSTGAALVTYLSGSNATFDATYPQTANLGGGLGVNAVYKVSWAAGTATNSAITEAVIVNDAATNATSTAANTAARIVFSAVNKGASDTLALTWTWKFLGA